MGIDIQQVKDNEFKIHRRTPKSGKLIKLVILGGTAALLIGGATFYGMHAQWQTGHALSKIEKQAQRNQKNSQTAITKPVSASEVKGAAIQSGVKPDYSGEGGLADKDTMLKLAHSNKPEILRGYVAVPSFNISEAIYEGTSNHVLAIGVGLNKPNAFFGKGLVPIFGHNMGDYNAIWPYYPTKFSALQNMTEKTIIGEPIYVSDSHTVYEYRATKLQSALPVKQMEKELVKPYNGQPEVQLIACLEDADFWRQVKASGYTNFHAPKRIVLTGKLVGQTSISDVPNKLRMQLQG